MANTSVETGEMFHLLVAIFSSVGTSIIFNDVKEVTNGLLHTPIVKFFILYGFCYTILNKDKVKALYGAWCALIVYTFLTSLAERYPQTVAGKTC